MFIGELSCLAVYFGIYYFRRRLWLKRNMIGESNTYFELDEELNEEPLIPKFNIFIFLPPAICDVIATSFMYIGLNLTTASSFQMLRGLTLLFFYFNFNFCFRLCYYFYWIFICYVFTISFTRI